MSSFNFDYQHPPFEKTIQLYGDRTGGQGNFEFAGFAELKETKSVLLKGNPLSLEQPTDWRRLLRLINLAQRLEKPILFWNLPIAHAATIKHPTSLALGTAIQNTKMQLLKLPQPIITVFDENFEWDVTIRELGWADGFVIVKTKKEDLPVLLDLKLQNLKTVNKQVDIPEQILAVLQDVSKLTSEELIAHRLESLHLPTDNQR